VVNNAAVSAGLLRLDLELGWPLEFLPGQFAMLNLTGELELVFGRPFSIFAAEGPVVSFLYRVVGRGTGLLAGLQRDARLTCLAPLGRPFPEPADPPVLLLAGGVGLPPLHAWWDRYRRANDRAYFGARDGGDVPWSLLRDDWRVSVEAAKGSGREQRAFVGLVTEAAQAELAAANGLPRPWRVMACGPLPLLRAAADWARHEGWECLVSVEEHMGCGYGVCKGCVVPTLAAGDEALAPAERPFRPAMSCEVGPVFPAHQIDWDRFGRQAPGAGSPV
jgi:dihydroorotate dehydrogenase electron transfer subunit